MDVSLPATEITALLGRGTEFEGKLCFDGRVRIDGKFRGEIRGEDVLVVGEGADIEADIEVGTLIVKGGRLQGNIRARTAIELYIPAEVSGSLLSPEIYMDKGVRLAGSCQIGPVEQPSIRAPSEPANEIP
jgi:cytoskeletal protein CcmA (bactofilin family)